MFNLWGSGGGACEGDAPSGGVRQLSPQKGANTSSNLIPVSSLHLRMGFPKITPLKYDHVEPFAIPPPPLPFPPADVHPPCFPVCVALRICVHCRTHNERTNTLNFLGLACLL